MPRETRKASEDTKKFFTELPIPKGINGNEVNGQLYWELFLDSSKDFVQLAIITETFRRMQDFFMKPLLRKILFSQCSKRKLS